MEVGATVSNVDYVSDAPEEIRQLIFNRLDGKALGQAALVCRAWHTTIRNPSFEREWLVARGMRQPAGVSDRTWQQLPRPEKTPGYGSDYALWARLSDKQRLRADVLNELGCQLGRAASIVLPMTAALLVYHLVHLLVPLPATTEPVMAIRVLVQFAAMTASPLVPLFLMPRITDSFWSHLERYRFSKHPLASWPPQAVADWPQATAMIVTYVGLGSALSGRALTLLIPAASLAVGECLVYSTDLWYGKLQTPRPFRFSTIRGNLGNQALFASGRAHRYSRRQQIVRWKLPHGVRWGALLHAEQQAERQGDVAPVRTWLLHLQAQELSRHSSPDASE